MSDPIYRHIKPDQLDTRVSEHWVPARFAQMRCDGAFGCRNSVARAPRLQVPPKPFILGGPKNLRMMTTLHYCERHAQQTPPPVTAEALLRPKLIADFERIAKLKWPHDIVPDFEAAWIEWVLVTTPEYRRFLAAIEVNTVNRGLLI